MTEETTKRLKKLAKEHPQAMARLALKRISDAERYKQYSKLSNKEIAKMLLEKVWADTDLWTEKSAIIEQAIERLNRS